MNLAAAVAGLAFLLVVTLVVGLWWFMEIGQRIRERLGTSLWLLPNTETELLRMDPRETGSKWGMAISPFATLVEQAGYHIRHFRRFLSLIGVFAVMGGFGVWLRTGGVVWGIIAACIAGAVPVLHLVYRRHKRLQAFEKQLPDTLDMMTRSIRAGHALSGAIQMVSEEMPDPVAHEFRRVLEESRLGMEPGEALLRLRRRVPTGDMGFFCSAMAIQRSAGGNLAEILDSLSEVIRERFKVLDHARVLSAQHRWSAVCVGVFPVVLAVLLELLNPGYFRPLLDSPLGPSLITVGVILEVVGFFTIWRIAQIRV